MNAFWVSNGYHTGHEFEPRLGNTVFSVSAVLSVFMTGLALGSWLPGRFVDRESLPLTRVYSLLEAGVGGFNLLIPILLKVTAPLFGALYAVHYHSAVILAIGRFCISFVLLIIPATLMGATLPVLVRFYVENIESAGWQVGRIYAVSRRSCSRFPAGAEGGNELHIVFSRHSEFRYCRRCLACRNFGTEEKFAV